MSIKVQTNFSIQLKPKTYLLYILINKHIPWSFCMQVLMDVFHKTEEQASLITDEILTNGEGLCGAYSFEIAENKAEIVKALAKKKELDLECLIEDV